MKRSRALALALLLLAEPASGQAGPAAADAAAHAVTLQIGSEVALTLLDELSSKHTQKGTTFRLAVAEDVVAGGVVVIPAGTPAVGEVTRSEQKGAFGRSGRLEARVLYIVLDGRPVRMSGALCARGRGGTTGTVVTALVAGTLAWAVTGRSAVLAKGTRLTAFLDRPLTVTPAAAQS